MGVTLERVQNKFACIIGELCSEPDILSQFAVWVDLRIAEYKAKGAISLDCTGMTPDPTWLKGLKTSNAIQPDPPLQKGRNARHKNQVSEAAQNSSFDTTVHPEWSSKSHNADSVVVIKQETDDNPLAFPVSLHSNHSNSTTSMSRKRPPGDNTDVSQSDNNVFSSSSAPSKSRRLSPHSDNSLSGEGQDTVSNQSLLSVIGVGDQPDQTPLNTLIAVGENSADRTNTSEDVTGTCDDTQAFYHQSAATDSAQTDYGVKDDKDIIWRARSLVPGCYSGEERAVIGRFAIQHGNTRAAVHYSKILGRNINESTVRTFKKRLMEVAKAQNCHVSEVTSIPSRR